MTELVTPGHHWWPHQRLWRKLYTNRGDPTNLWERTSPSPFLEAAILLSFLGILPGICVRGNIYSPLLLFLCGGSCTRVTLPAIGVFLGWWSCAALSSSLGGEARDLSPILQPSFSHLIMMAMNPPHSLGVCLVFSCAATTYYPVPYLASMPRLYTLLAANGTDAI